MFMSGHNIAIGEVCSQQCLSESQELGVQYGGWYGRRGVYCLLLTR